MSFFIDLQSVAVKKRTYNTTLSPYYISIVIFFIFVIFYTLTYPSFAQTTNCVLVKEQIPTTEIETNHVEALKQEAVTLTLQEQGMVHEEIILHVNIAQGMMPANAWGRVAIRSSITLEDGSIQEGRLEVLEGVPETTMHFPQKGMYELTISVGYLIKST